MMKVIRECGRARNAQGWRKLGPRGLCGNSNLGQPPCTIGLYIITYSNSAGKLGDERKKLDWVPLARWNHKNEIFLQYENLVIIIYLTFVPDGASQSKEQNKKRQEKLRKLQNHVLSVYMKWYVQILQEILAMDEKNWAGFP
jgi:hypothetical protein